MEFLGYDFKDESLLQEALTTPAFKMDSPRARDNQRLEFLGDAVLQLLASDAIYHMSGTMSEGELTFRRAAVVSTQSLCSAAARCSLQSRLRRNSAATQLPGNSKSLADAVEAVIGAAWLDGGLEAARTVFESLGLAGIAVDPGMSASNPKGELQIKAQALVPPRRPVYESISVTGPSHKPVFTVKVSVEGVGEATASAGSRKEAEAAAAEALLEMSNGGKS